MVHLGSSRPNLQRLSLDARHACLTQLSSPAASPDSLAPSSQPPLKTALARPQPHQHEPQRSSTSAMAIVATDIRACLRKHMQVCTKWRNLVHRQRRREYSMSITIRYWRLDCPVQESADSCEPRLLLEIGRSSARAPPLEIGIARASRLVRAQGHHPSTSSGVAQTAHLEIDL